eukprot:3647125-Amphidinium_carterae.1
MGPPCVGGFPLLGCAVVCGRSSFCAFAAGGGCQSGFSVRTTLCGLSGTGGTGGLVPSRVEAPSDARSICCSRGCADWYVGSSQGFGRASRLCGPCSASK